MARPKSMPDFSALMDASKPLSESEHARKKPSISLAAGLIMNSESPKSMPTTPQPPASLPSGGCSIENPSLFYAYAQKSDYAQSAPYILTFASAAVCDQWWSLVQREYPDSTRMGPQLFILKGDDMQEQIQDNPRFKDLRNKWFYTSSEGATGVIPLQDYKGNPICTPRATSSSAAESFDMSKLSDALDKMNAMISSNSEQIQALSVAQSSGLQRMQEINEFNSTQIKALTESQSKLQSLVTENANQYIALSNSSFQHQEHIKTVLQANAEQISGLANGQAQLTKTCEGMMRTIANLGNTVGRVNDTMSHMNATSMASETASNATATTTASSTNGPPFSAVGNRISPPPRKLNRRIKGVWYEYDSAENQVSQARKRVNFIDTPSQSPVPMKTA